MVRQAAAELVPILAADVDDVVRVLLLLLLLELVLGRYHLPRTGQAGQIRWRRLLLEPVAIGSDAGPVRQEGLLMERVAVVVVVVLVEVLRGVGLKIICAKGHEESQNFDEQQIFFEEKKTPESMQSTFHILLNSFKKGDQNYLK